MTGSKHKTKIPQLKLTKIKSTATQLTHKWCRKLFLDTNFTKVTQAIVCQHHSAWLCILASPLTHVILNKSLNLSVPVPYLQNGNNSGAYFRDRKNWSCSVVSLCDPMDYYQALPSMGFPRQEYWSGCHFLLHGIFSTQGLNLGLPHCMKMLYCLRHQGSGLLQRVAVNYLQCAWYISGLAISIFAVGWGCIFICLL